MFWNFCYAICLICFKLFYRLKIQGKENVLLNGRVIFVGNHQSYLDVPVMGILTFPRKINFMAKEELFHIFWLRPIIKALYGFPVKKETVDRKALKTALSLLESEQALGLFPEGTRHRPAPSGAGHRDGLGEPYHGVALIALRSGAPIVPIAISGTEKVLPDGKRVPHFPKIKVKIGKAIAVDKKEGKIEKQELKTLTGKVMNNISKLLEEVKNEDKSS